MRIGVFSIMMCCACTINGGGHTSRPFGSYLGADTQLLADNLVNFQVRMRGQLTSKSITDYADCVAAQHSADRGFPYVRVIRTNLYKEGGVHVADAIYTPSPVKPRGASVIDTAAQIAICANEGIPTV